MPAQIPHRGLTICYAELKEFHNKCQGSYKCWGFNEMHWNKHSVAKTRLIHVLQCVAGDTSILSEIEVDSPYIMPNYAISFNDGYTAYSSWSLSSSWLTSKAQESNQSFNKWWP